MRTEDDIRDALDVEPDRAALSRLSGFADELADRPGAAVASPVRRRMVPVLAAAAAVVLVVGGGAALVRLRDGRSTASGDRPLSASQRRPVWNLRVATVPGYSFARVNASSIGRADGSTVTIASTDAKRPEQGVMTTCPRSLRYCADPSYTRHSAVTVDGRAGYFFPGTHTGSHTLPRDDLDGQHPWQVAATRDANQPGLVWYAGHHTTVFLAGTFGFDPKARDYDNTAARKILLRIASAVSAGHRDAARLPFELRDLPGRVAPESVRIEHGGACSEYGTGPRSASDALGIVFTACRVPTGATRAATVEAADSVDSNRTNGTTRFEPLRPVVHDYADGTSLVLAVETDRRGIVTLRQARRLAARADVSPRLGVPSSWIVVG